MSLVPELFRPLVDLPSAIARRAASLTGPPARRGRRVWYRHERAHLEVRGVDREGGEPFAEALEKAVSEIRGVDWAQVNPVLSRLIVAFDGDEVDLEDVLAVVEGVEEASGLAEETFSADVAAHPGDPAPLRQTALAIAANTVGLGLGLAAGALRLPRLPVEAASAAGILEFFPPLRAVLEGNPVADTAVIGVNAVLQGLGQGPLGLLVDTAHRLNLATELSARQQAWHRAEPALFPAPRADRPEPAPAAPRPVPLPSGPIESYGRLSSLASAGAGGLALVASGDPRRAADLVLVGIPRAARLGRESFAAHTGRLLSGRGIVPMDPRALRVLDRLDTLVLDAAAVATGPEPQPGAAELVKAARGAGLTTILCGGSSGLAGQLGVERTLAGGRRLATSVELLQREGAVVGLVSSRPGRALRAADVGIGVVAAGQHPPWGADLLCPHLASAVTVVDAARLARTASRNSVALSALGSGAGGLLALGALPGAGHRALAAAQVSTLAAMAAGVWTAHTLPPTRVVPEPPVAWHSFSSSEVLERLGVGDAGLSADEADRRRPPEGVRRPPAFLTGVGSELANPLSVILGAGAGLSAAVGSLVDAVMVGGVLGLNAVIGGLQRARTEAAIDRLERAVVRGSVVVVRDGTSRHASADELVPGDLVEVDAGDAVPADCRIVTAVGLEADESSLTGESVPVTKTPDSVPTDSAVADRASMLYAGTAVAAGRARAVVVATGSDVEARRGLDGDERPPETGVEARLRSLTDRTVPVVLAAGGGLAVNGLLRGQPVRSAVATGVGLAAAAVPEGLPFVATAAQAAAARRMSARGILVRNPRVLEALGRVDVLCFDKTGTLTEGRLQLRQVSDGEVEESVERLSGTRREVLAAALRATPRAREEALPHPTDQAVVDGADEAGVALSDGLPGWEKLGSLPFEPGRSYHAVLGRNGQGAVLSVKGAPEVVLPRCTEWVRTNGERVPIDQPELKQFEAEVDRLARRGLRVLAVAERSASGRKDLDDARIDGLAFRGLVGVADAARSSAIEPLRHLLAAGISVVMVTGDHPSTAEAVAAELGILNDGDILGGPELDAMTDEELDRAIGKVSVFARVTPADKVRIVKAFQRVSRVVAMTGDGANDAQAIRLADIGIAFGPGATPAARDAADLVVVDDRVESLIDAIAEGRAMWGSVRDALGILLGGNLGEVAFTTGAALIAGRPPLTARQLLAVNLFTDLVPAMAIAVQPPRSGRVDLAHEGPDTSLGGALVRDIAIRASATAIAAAGAWSVARVTGTPQRARTVALASLVGAQLGQTLVVGHRSPLVVASTLVSAAGLAAVIHTPGINQFFECQPLGPVGWALALSSAGLGTVGAVVADRLIPAATRPAVPVAGLSVP
ncbi:MAG TPA: HAD-IC family P-type ATPase [Acidimicrobiales bacterium]|nr:HAD-IC family P-type ATPase [Acidimicrobiales bacterium]